MLTLKPTLKNDCPMWPYLTALVPLRTCEDLTVCGSSEGTRAVRLDLTVCGSSAVFPQLYFHMLRQRRKVLHGEVIVEKDD